MQHKVKGDDVSGNTPILSYVVFYILQKLLCIMYKEDSNNGSNQI